MTGQNSQVWEVMHDGRQQRLAMKTLLSDFRKNREHLGYLRHEYEVGRKLEHPRVIRIYELGTRDGVPYLIMEFFPWPNLKQYINRGVDRIAYLLPDVIRQCAEGLAYFNSQGWVHRDVKPDNYLMTDEGEIRLIDFALAVKPKTGLARLFSLKSKIQGTRSYMSPEQIRGEALDQRADVYSFGCMVHELLTGKPPYTGTSANELLNKHLKAAIPPADAGNKNVTPEMAALVRKTLSKDPAKRPESLEKFLREYNALRPFKEMPRKPTEAA
ncbi:MAG: serine/threonine protein kinase [Pirellulales bacterium]|nr:serine/threonine protein kinase [Pirellulales bacterium]